MSRKVIAKGLPIAGETSRCPWCSATLTLADMARCPSCGAALHEVPGEEIPGVTRVDHEAILHARTSAPKSRGLIGWLSGDVDQGSAEAAPAGSFAPPPDEVRREMLRLEMAALEAEVKSRRAESDAELAGSDAELAESDAELAAAADGLAVAAAEGPTTHGSALGDQAPSDQAPGNPAAPQS